MNSYHTSYRVAGAKPWQSRVSARNNFRLLQSLTLMLITTDRNLTKFNLPNEDYAATAAKRADTKSEQEILHFSKCLNS